MEKLLTRSEVEAMVTKAWDDVLQHSDDDEARNHASSEALQLQQKLYKQLGEQELIYGLCYRACLIINESDPVAAAHIIHNNAAQIKEMMVGIH